MVRVTRRVWLDIMMAAGGVTLKRAGWEALIWMGRVLL